MSLLMKALEKAAKDRMDARAEPVAVEAPAPAPAPAAKELTLEPIAAEAPVAPRADAAPRPVAPTLAPREQAQAQASAVLQASATSRPRRGGVGAYVRAHPLPVLGTIAGLFAVGFGVYVYLQIAHPGMFIERPPLAPAKGPVGPLVQAPVAPAGPLPAAPLLKEAAAESAAAAAAAPREKPRPAVAAAAPEDSGPRNTVVVSPGSAETVLHPMLPQAYTALQAGQLDQARRLYSDVLGTEPKNADALLGLAAIAVREGNSDEATRRYLQLLELEPQNALAQSGLIALLGRADPVAAESKLKQLIAREPSAHLYFTLGNLYADQSQWAAAQYSYFQAHHLEPSNPDYAYNLAVGLEHVSQPKLALGFYQRAMQLAAVKGRANFNLAQAQERIGKLVAQVE
jgi:tetratricopeptide (TPR) repeat protein